MVASTDGVGTKLKVAILAGRHNTVGVDLVNHCVNDILVEGARPLFLQDYISMGKLEPGVVEQLLEGLARGCSENGCALLGGETAEMPDFYKPGDYDLAGFIVGIVDEDERLGAHRVREGDVLIGLPSSGFHTNGYSLLRQLFFDRMGLWIDDPYPESGESVGEVLLRPHRSYASLLRPFIDGGLLCALAHITGGGIPENLPRVLSASLIARINRASWQVPNEFLVVQKHGQVTDNEMFLTFNMGVGMIAVVRERHADAVVLGLNRAGGKAWIMGDIRRGSGVDFI